MPDRRPKEDAETPSRKALLTFIDEQEDGATRRDIARAFNIRGEERSELRSVLKELVDAGQLERTGRARYRRLRAVPPVAPIDVVHVNDDGDLIANLGSWRGPGDPPAIIIEARLADRMKPSPGVGDRILARIRENADGAYSGDPIKAIGRGGDRFLAVIKRDADAHFAMSVERGARRPYRVDRNDLAGASDGDIVWVEAKNDRSYGGQKVRVRTIEGKLDSPSAYSLIALANNGVPQGFSDEALEEANKAKFPPLSNRVDLRDVALLTIDPASAKDHDDAVFAAEDDAPENKGGFRVIVAIADVAAFVRPGGALDRDARERGNSTYLPDRVAPMLPERLSTDLCSLRPDEDRPCLAVELVLSAEGRKLNHRFMRATMRSAAKLSYEDAQAIIDGGDGPSKTVADTVRTLHRAFRARLKERAKRAPLDLELEERVLILGEDGALDHVEVRERFDAHRLIEEFMILANVAAAEALEKKKRTFVYRVHDQPDPERLEGARDYLETLGYSLLNSDAVRPSHFNQLLKLAGKRDEKELVSDVVLRAQRQAVYATDNLGHFGLNLHRYAHFTSPIRRYADLIVHRALISAFSLGDGGQTTDEEKAISRIADDISQFERRSMAAEREAKDRFLADYLSDRVGAEFSGRIRGVTRAGLFICLDETGADGLAPMRSLGDERFHHDENAQALVGERTGGAYHLGQKVRVRLAEATPLSGGLRFDILTEPIKGHPRKSAKKKKAGFNGRPNRKGRAPRRGKEQKVGKKSAKRRR